VIVEVSASGAWRESIRWAALAGGLILVQGSIRASGARKGGRQ
jgi:hypothetical protein